MPSREAARGGRGDGRGRRREEREERHRRRFPPPAEVAYEILAGAERPLALTEVAALGAERFLMPDASVRDAGSLGAALREDNRRRESAGPQAPFVIEGETVSLAARELGSLLREYFTMRKYYPNNALAAARCPFCRCSEAQEAKPGSRRGRAATSDES